MTETTYKVTPTNLTRVMALLNRAAAGIPGLTLTAGVEQPQRVTRYEMQEGARGRMERVAVAHWHVGVVPVTVGVPDIDATGGWRYIAEREAKLVRWVRPSTTAAEAAAVMSTLPERHTTCEACGLSRTRYTTVVLADRDGRTLQVGGACVAKYLPSRLRAALNALAEATAIMTPGGSDEDYYGPQGYHDATWVSIPNVLRALASMDGQPYVASKGRDGNPHPDATWRKVWAAAQVAERLTESALPPGDWTILASIRESMDDTGVLDRWLADGALDRRGVAYFVGAWRKATSAPKADAPLVTPQDGRRVITGQVLNTKQVESQWGYTTKVLVQCDGFRLFGSLPSSADAPEAGTPVRFTATVEPKEPGFGFFSRPTKWEVAAAEVAA